MKFFPWLAASVLTLSLAAQEPAVKATPAPVSTAAPAASAPASTAPVAATPFDPTTQFDPFGNHPRVFNNVPQYRVDALMVSLPQEKALPLLPSLRDSKQVEAAQAKILELIAKKEAHLLDWPEVTACSGNRAVSETIVEQRYPIEFEQPQQPETFSSAPQRELSPAEKALSQLRTLGLVVPVSFETRNSGSTLEADCVVSPDGKAVSLSVAVQDVQLVRWAEFAPGKTEKGELFSVKQPIFMTQRISSSTTLHDGERRLIYVGQPQEPGGEITLFVVGVKIIPAIQ